ncbi:MULTISPECIES: hypothetical protein [unclassified Thiobacillus]|uniref:hypothetical protein n=1 Tax=unclassified Thiobacillus TaxID=2646513 RepID=UPI00086DF257|nr:MULTISPECIES: hypothetical protein [unclassified Thiobacillus]ODV04239.1 MAG: hypothetical protein ABT23_01600 [Thiobacillus sp. SCN 63-57]OJY59765.1 MAG: hypothetical protein BGP19_12705 [Thiobacillus sp. 0-1251]
MKKDILVFWTAALGTTLGLCAILFPYAAVPAATLSKAQTPQPMENMADLDLGKDYGTVSVTDLVGYYLENPPAPKSAAAQAEAPHRFGGC